MLKFSLDKRNIYAFIKALKTIIKFSGDIVIYGDTEGVSSKLVFLSLGVQGTAYLQLIFPNQFFERIVICGRDQTTTYKKSNDLRTYARKREITLDSPDAVAVKIVSQNLKNAIFPPAYINSYEWEVNSGALIGSFKTPPNLLVATCVLNSGHVKTDRIRCTDADIKLPQLQISHEYHIQMFSRTLHNILKPFDTGKKNEFGSKVTLWAKEGESRRRLYIQTDYEAIPGHDGTIVSKEIPDNLVLIHNLDQWVYVNFDVAEYKTIISLFKGIHKHKKLQPTSNSDDDDTRIETNFQLKNSSINPVMEISGIETACPIRIMGYLRATAKFVNPMRPEPVIQNAPIKTFTSSLSYSPSSSSNNIAPLTPQHPRGSFEYKEEGFITPLHRTSAHQGMITPEVTPHRLQRENTVEVLDDAISQVSLDEQNDLDENENIDFCHPHKKPRPLIDFPKYEEKADETDLTARYFKLKKSQTRVDQ
ncbi:12535_t:CDS:2 [Ambispora leptoticha]|uniref:12535_t:CDS:1 n=1 Tax=Ambispora leptoticha TaxID=144679 RepID=A0A9N9ACK7_9GLOM|nr:12535_t:CDS:2 [Ambispora leptoticha]